VCTTYPTGQDCGYPAEVLSENATPRASRQAFVRIASSTLSITSDDRDCRSSPTPHTSPLGSLLSHCGLSSHLSLCLCLCRNPRLWTSRAHPISLLTASLSHHHTHHALLNSLTLSLSQLVSIASHRTALF
jgi:hypothetical protein